MSGNLTFSSKVDLLKLDYLNQFKNIPVVLPSSRIKIIGKSVQGFVIYDLTSKQTNKDYYLIYILAWEPSVSRRLPEHCRKLRF